MIYVVCVIFFLAALVLGARYLLLSRCVKDTQRQLQQITENFEENCIVKLKHPDPNMERMLVAVNDLLKKSRSALIQSRLREKEFQKEIENISHDLRTPLTSITGYLKIMDTEALSDEDREYMVTVLRKTDVLQRLVEQFYEYSRVSTGDWHPEMEAVDAARLLRETLLGAYDTLALDVEVCIPEQPVMIMANGSALERVFLNLLQNSGRYACSRLKIQMTCGDGRVHICFMNDVSGLQAEDIPHLFERFHTGDAARNKGGTGLGLPIARSLTEGMGGTLEAELCSGKTTEDSEDKAEDKTSGGAEDTAWTKTSECHETKEWLKMLLDFECM